MSIMEVGTEISQKIRSAIKAKLLELGSYVDDELPDYIMVMVANKKTRAQMNGDLGLFLGTSTIAFTDWLHGLLEKLQTIRIEPEPNLTAHDKSEKSKSKEKKKDKKSHKGDNSVKKHSHKAKKKDSEVVVSDDINTDTTVFDSTETTVTSKDSEIQEETKSGSSNVSNDASSQLQVENNGLVNKESIIDDFEDVRQLLVTGATEDELTNELETTEVEIIHAKTVKNTSKPVATPSKDIITSSDVLLTSTQNHSPERRSIQKRSEVVRKRKAPTSVVAPINQKDEDEEYDPHNPAVASVVRVTARKSSVPPMLQANRLLLMKAMVEAERSVATKKKIGVTKPLSRDDSPSEVYSPKRKRDTSEDQDSPPPYIPSKKDSIGRRGNSSSSSHHGDVRVLSRNDARHMINRDGGRELTAKSYREVVRTPGHDRDTEHKRKLSRSPERSRRQKEDDRNVREVTSDKIAREMTIDKNMMEMTSDKIVREIKRDKNIREVTSDKIVREVKNDKNIREVTSIKPVREVNDKNIRDVSSIKPVREVKSDNNIREVTTDRSSKGDKNIQITCHLGSESVSSVSRVERKRQHSSSPEPKKPLQVTVYPFQNTKSTASRLGKIVVERNSSEGDDRESDDARGSHAVTGANQRDAREDIIAKAAQSKSKESPFLKPNIGPVISSAGKEAFQKQCEAAVISVRAAQTGARVKRNMSPDSRVVECDTQNSEDVQVEEDSRQHKEEKKGEELMSEKQQPAADEADQSLESIADDDDDLSKMIDEDLCPELLHDTNGDDFNLDLDIDDDLGNVNIAESTKDESTKDDSKRGTRFIVTLDGVDERQFQPEDSGNTSDKFKNPAAVSAPAVAPPVKSSNTQAVQPDQHLYLSLLAAQARPVSQALLQQIQTSAVTVPSKLTPPKIQPFSICLKDSDDEHDDKEGKPSAGQEEYYQQTQGDVSAVKRAKMSERCRFWPACAAGLSCEYHHPTAHCKTFPSCKFGDKCLFIHPNCRFDSKCARPDCPYTHTSRRPALASAAHVIAIPKSHFVFSTVPPKANFTGRPSTQGMCRFFPNCQNINCAFPHPKPCKFGMACKSPACPFYHPQVPTFDKLKWQASHIQAKTEIIATLPTSAKEEQPVDKQSPSTTSNSATVSSTSQ